MRPHFVRVERRLDSTGHRLFPMFMTMAAAIPWLAGEARAQQPVLDWVQQFGGMLVANDVANAIDASGNVYVVGQTQTDVFLRKYDAAGVEAWTRIFGTVGTETLEDVAVDAGGVVVAGTTFGTLPGQVSPGLGDAMLRKYDHDGNEIWTRQFGSSNLDQAMGVTILDGAIYVAGNTFGALPGPILSAAGDAFLAKFDADGSQAWVRQFGTVLSDSATSVRGGGSTIYVVGNTFGALHAANAGSGDVYIRAYDANGALLWGTQFGSSAADGANAVAVSASALVLGGQTGSALPGQASSGSTDAFIARINLAGTQDWIRQFGTGGADLANGIAVDETGIYVGGQTSSALGGANLGGTDAFVGRFSLTGSPQWLQQSTVSSAGTDRVTAVALGPAGVYCSGSTTGVLAGATSAGGTDAFVRALDRDGSGLWTRQFGFPSSTPASDRATAVAADGSIYVGGSTSGIFTGQTSAGGQDCYVRKGDMIGNEVWLRQFGSASTDSISGMAADATGVFVVGFTSGVLPGQVAAGGVDAFVRRYDAAGNELWTRQFGTTTLDEALAVFADASSIYICGRTAGAIDGVTPTGGAFVRKCDLGGNPVWTRILGSGSNSRAVTLSVHAGEVYVGGRVPAGALGATTASTIFDGFVAKFDAMGGLLWTRPFTGENYTFQDLDEITCLHADAAGVIACGNVSGNLPGEFNVGETDVFVSRYTAAGSLEWATQEGSLGFDTASGIASVGGKLFVAGTCSASFRSRPFNGVYPTRDVFVYQCDGLGNPGWTYTTATTFDESATGIAAVGNRIFVCGETFGDLTTPQGSGQSTADAFLLALRLGDGPVDTIAPIADAGPDLSIHAGNSVFLDGSNSSDDTSATTALVYEWTLTAKPAASLGFLQAQRQIVAVLLADVPGEYRFSLTVTDEQGNRSLSDEVVISSNNLAPTADAGPDRIGVVGSAIEVDGSASYDPENDNPLSYQWMITSAPAGSSAYVNNPEWSPGYPYNYLWPDVVGTYELQLIVRDPFLGYSAADTVTIVVVTPADLVQMRLQVVCTQIAGFATSCFDAPGHQISLCNKLAQIPHFMQVGNLIQARAHLEQVLSRMDGWVLRSAFDPKGGGQPYPADFLVSYTEQFTIWNLLTYEVQPYLYP